MFGYFASKQNNHVPSTLPGIRHGSIDQIEHEDNENGASGHSLNLKVGGRISYVGKNKYDIALLHPIVHSSCCPGFSDLKAEEVIESNIM